MQFNSLSEIIKKAQKKYPVFGKRVAEAEALGRWELAVGPAIAKHSKVVRVRDSVLVVEVEHPIWRSELHYRKKQILDILNGVTPGGQPGLPPPQESVVDIQFIEPSRRG